MTKRRGEFHLIADIVYRSGGSVARAPMLCSCGWVGLSDEFRVHRKDNGFNSGGKLRDRAVAVEYSN